MNHVLELFFKKNMKKVLELQLCFCGGCNFKTYSILFIFHSYVEHDINKGCVHPISNQEICVHGMSQLKSLTQN